MQALFVSFALLFFVAMLLLRRHLPPTFRGALGEIQSSISTKKLDSATYKTLHDVYLPTKYGSTQIDHIVVSKHGIFVIETKYWSGKLYGSEEADYWKQYLPGTVNRLYNPIKQNAGHVIAVSNITKSLTPLAPISIIAVKNAAVLRVRSQTAVVKIAELADEIMRHQSVVLSQHQVEAIVALLQNANITDAAVRKQHAEQVRAYVRAKKFR